MMSSFALSLLTRWVRLFDPFCSPPFLLYRFGGARSRQRARAAMRSRAHTRTMKAPVRHRPVSHRIDAPTLRNAHATCRSEDPTAELGAGGLQRPSLCPSDDHRTVKFCTWAGFSLSE